MDANWDDLKVVLAVSRTGSLTLAAEVLGMDQSTCSRRLGTIEAGLGVILFLRSRSGLSVTEAGETVVRRAAEIERRMGRLHEELSQGPDGPVGLVRLIGNPWTLERLAGEPALRLLDAHPRLELRLIPYHPRASYRADPTMSLWFEQSPRDGEFAIRLCEVPYTFYRSRAHDPAGLPWVSFADEDSPQLAHVKTLELVRRKGERVRLGSGDNRVLMAAMREVWARASCPCAWGPKAPTSSGWTTARPSSSASCTCTCILTRSRPSGSRRSRAGCARPPRPPSGIPYLPLGHEVPSLPDPAKRRD
jgi:DNA-binding transcriptional LysR family regulator